MPEASKKPVYGREAVVRWTCRTFTWALSPRKQALETSTFGAPPYNPAPAEEMYLSEKEWRARRKVWQPRKPRYRRGVLAKYARQVSTASKGAVTD